jgi:hypothetical protein
MDNNILFLSLQIGMGAAWALAYILIIIKGFKDKTYGMPMAAICANVSWEFIFSFIFNSNFNNVQIIINIVWFVLDILILLQYLIYGKKEFLRDVNTSKFLIIFLTTLFICFSIIVGITFEFNDFQGKYAAFSQNLMMSILFVLLLTKRRNLKGQSIYIALFKMIGSFLPAIYLFLFNFSILITILSVITLIFDLLYSVLIYNKYKELKIHP